MFRFAARRLEAAVGPKALKVGDTIPDSQVFLGVPPKATSTADMLKGKKVFLFAVPGAFTAKCNNQLPQYTSGVEELKKKFDVSQVMCVATNDSFVMKAWAESVSSAPEAVTMVSDPMHSLLDNLGHVIDLPVLGGDRYARIAMVVDDGKIARLWEEADGKGLDNTACEAVMKCNPKEGNGKQ